MEMIISKYLIHRECLVFFLPINLIFSFEVFPVAVT